MTIYHVASRSVDPSRFRTQYHVDPKATVQNKKLPTARCQACVLSQRPESTKHGIDFSVRSEQKTIKAGDWCIYWRDNIPVRNVQISKVNKIYAEDVADTDFEYFFFVNGEEKMTFRSNLTPSGKNTTLDHAQNDSATNKTSPAASSGGGGAGQFSHCTSKETIHLWDWCMYKDPLSMPYRRIAQVRKIDHQRAEDPYSIYISNQMKFKYTDRSHLTPVNYIDGLIEEQKYTKYTFEQTLEQISWFKNELKKSTDGERKGLDRKQKHIQRLQDRMQVGDIMKSRFDQMKIDYVYFTWNLEGETAHAIADYLSRQIKILEKNLKSIEIQILGAEKQIEYQQTIQPCT